MNREPYVMAQSVSTPVVINKVLRNTYLLLSLTLAFSAIMAVVSMQQNWPYPGTIIFLVGAIGGQFLINALRNSAAGILAVFAWTGFMGAILGPILNAYLAMYTNGGMLIAYAFGSTAMIFFSLSGYALTTKRDFSFLGGMLFAGMMVAFIAAIANIWLQIPALSLAISSVAVLVFSGFILWETQQIARGGIDNYIIATTMLFASIWNLFVHLLHLLSFLMGEE